ncbi:MAG TPA: glucose 1-dehydrogenase [Candidatus Limnocylindrales bacterium]|nr:glucose 1-dehydrogenase [Candidatus Limnocylindrales bacterium]
MLEDLFGLEGKVSLVTGAGRGIGKAAAIGLAEAGSQVVLVSRSRNELEEVAREVRNLGRKALVLPADLLQFDKIPELVTRTVEEFGRLDILVNNAGTNLKRPTVEVPWEDFDKIIGLNLKAAFILSQAAIKHMLKQGSGKIINVTSMTAAIGIPTSAIYCSSKGGLQQLTKSLAVELAPKNIQVNAIAPGMIETELAKPILARPEFRNWVMPKIPMGRLGVPDDLKGAFIFLASPASNYVTGHTLFVDGGWLAG